MDKLNEALSRIAERIFDDFVARGGVIRENESSLGATVVASPQGGLPAILWVVQQFYQDYSLDFPQINFRRDPTAHTGYALEAVVVPHASSPVLLMVSDFLRNEMLQEQVAEIDLGVMFSNFREWCAANVAPASGMEAGNQSEPDKDL